MIALLINSKKRHLLNKIGYFNQYVCLLLIVFPFYKCLAQPVLSTKKVFDEVVVYQDFKDKSLFYFAPGKIKLAAEANGKPIFSLLAMRFTGTSVLGNQAEKRFLNLVQFTIKLDNPPVEALNSVKNQLGGKSIQLRPLPVRYIDTRLAASFESAQNEVKEREIASSAGVQDDKQSASESYWTERILSFRLENHEAQLLIEQLEKKRTSMALNYAFFADCINGSDGVMNIKGSNAKVVREFKNATSEMGKDTIVKTQAISGDAIRFELDVERWKDLVKKVDLNEEVPPSYAIMEVKCFDFVNNLRPDLYMKTVELQAVGVNGQIVTLPAKRFIKNKPDISSLQIQFPYAVRMYQPFKYRVTEYLNDGKRLEGNWINKNSFTELIDITTPLDSNKITSQSVEIEIDQEEFKTLSVEELIIDFVYFINDKVRHALMSFKSGDKSNQTQSFVFDKAKGLNFIITTKLKDSTYFIGSERALKNDYLFVSVKDIIK